MKKPGKRADPYEELGVSKDASDTDIKAAFRRKAKATHPDGGADKDAFERVKAAHLVLSDPDKRRRYDETGDAEEGPTQTPEQEAQSLLAGLVLAAIDGDFDASSSDLVDVLQRYLRMQREEIRIKRSSLDIKRKRAEKIAKNLTRKSKGVNILARAAEDKAKALAAQVARLDHGLLIHDKAMAALKDYHFKFTPPADTGWPSAPMTSTQGLTFEDLVRMAHGNRGNFR